VNPFFCCGFPIAPAFRLFRREWLKVNCGFQFMSTELGADSSQLLARNMMPVRSGNQFAGPVF
jgi:hypothetical protein